MASHEPWLLTTGQCHRKNDKSIDDEFHIRWFCCIRKEGVDCGVLLRLTDGSQQLLTLLHTRAAYRYQNRKFDPWCKFITL